MKLYDGGVTIILVVMVGVLIFSLLTACSGYSYNQDSLPEELVEEAIELETGISLDLSPNTPETGFSPKTLKPFESSR